MASPSSFQLLFLFICSVSFSLSFAQPSYRFPYCGTNGNYTNGSNFATNLNTLLSGISSGSNQITGGFYNRTTGSGHDQVNGIALCRGDVSTSLCNSCISDATKKIKEDCPNQKEAIVWYNECMLRYSNESILATLDSWPILPVSNVKNASNANAFDQQLGNLLRDLQSEAASGNSRLKFADGEREAGDFSNSYALVQCTPDLTSLDCSNCIESLINEIPSCCAGKIGAFIVAPSCTLRFETSQFYNSDDSISPPSSESPSTGSTGKGSKHYKLVIAIVVPTIACIAVIAVICAYRFSKTKRWEKVQSSASFNKTEDVIMSVESLQFDFTTIRAATNDFSDANKLGQGGFGPVYKGTLPSGQQFAVKRLAKNSAQGEDEFKNEVLLVAKLQHRNLVRLLGFCFHGDERLLIYEFVPNASLDRFLFDPAKHGQLDWPTRYKIIAGIARGLLYLHEDSRLRIIHRDLKTSNILLDAEMNAKISDFGLARLFDVGQTHADTNRIVGTYGYMAPEYALQGFFSAKSDVFSFGIIILEMITGRRNINLSQGQNWEDLISIVWRNWREGTPMHIVDEMISEGSTIEIIRCIHIGLLCIQEDATNRPNMSAVIVMMSSQSFTLPMPSHPAFVTHNLRALEVVSEEHSSVGTRSDGSGSKLIKKSVNVDTSMEVFPR